MAEFRCVFQTFGVFLLVICAMLLQGNNVSAADYYGKLIGSFGANTAHGVRGSVYAASYRRLFITGFHYDGSAPDAFVWMGDTTDASGIGKASSTGEKIPVDGSKATKLGSYNNAVIQLDLPKSLAQYKWISIWCIRFAANFGEVAIPASFEAPAEISLGELGFTPRVHNVYASNVVILNHRQLRIENLDYDGNGPDAYYWAGTGSSPRSSGFALADESRSGSTSKIPSGSFNGKTVTVTIPENQGDIFSIGYVGLWCVRFSQNFGHVSIPADVNVPPYGTESAGGTFTPPEDYDNCEVLIDDTYQARWTVTGDNITIGLSARVNPGTYMAFGLSGSDSRTTMVGSDVTVTWIGAESQGMANAVDYYLSAYQQCVIGSGKGACPDMDSTPTGSNDVTVGEFSNNNGIITISYTRALDTGSAEGDQVIPTGREVFLAWAIGPINPDGRAAKHRQVPSSNPKVDFGRTSSSCPAFNVGEVDVLDPWKIPSLGKGVTEFQLDMGQAGGQQGYEGITGQPGWGLAWYVNKLIIPELILQRNVTYTFTVNGGKDSTVQAAYHPFYITDDPEGGHFQKSQAAQDLVKIYAGPIEGSLCEWRSTGSYNFDDFSTFEAYRNTALERQCDPPEESAMLTFTPGLDTPQNLYYQCYTHKFLGWKIKIVDDYTSGSLPTTRFSILALFVSMLVAMIMM